MRRTLSLLVALTFAFVGVANAQGFHAKVEARKAEAEKVKDVKNTTDVVVTRSYADAFDDVLNWMKESKLEIDYVNTKKDSGILTTAIVETKGGMRKSGQRLTVSLVRSGESDTTLRVAVTNYTKLGLDNWSIVKDDGKDKKQVNPEETAKFVSDIKEAFKSHLKVSSQKK